MSDLSDKTVEELRNYEESHSDKTSIRSLRAFDELASRLAKAQAYVQEQEQHTEHFNQCYKKEQNAHVDTKEELAKAQAEIARMRPVVEAAIDLKAAGESDLNETEPNEVQHLLRYGELMGQVELYVNRFDK